MKYKIHGCVLLVFSIITASGCQHYRTCVPEFNQAPRDSLRLDPPVLFSVTDGRANSAKNEQLSRSFVDGIMKMYPGALEVQDYFAAQPKDRACIKLRIMALGADFGSYMAISTVSAVAFNNAGSSTAIATGMQGEGWWFGTTWLEVSFSLPAGGEKQEIVVPLAAQSKVFNWWGYPSGTQAAKMSWQQVQPKFIQLLDEFLISIRDRQDFSENNHWGTIKKGIN